MFDSETHLYLTPVHAGRAEQFEAFLRDVAQPAVTARRPELAGRYRLLKPSTAEEGDDGIVTYAFAFDGGNLEDWDLGKILAEHHGEEEADRLMQGWVSTFAPGNRWAGSLELTDEPTQIGWTFAPVGLGT